MKKRVIEKLESIEDAKIAFEQVNRGWRVLMGMEYDNSFILIVRPKNSEVSQAYRIRKKDYKTTLFSYAALSGDEKKRFHEAREKTAIGFVKKVELL